MRFSEIPNGNFSLKLKASEQSKRRHVAGFIDFIVDPSMQVMGDMLERIVQTSAQQSATTAPSQTAESDDANDSESSKTGNDVAASSANGGANSTAPAPVLPGKTSVESIYIVYFDMVRDSTGQIAHDKARHQRYIFKYTAMKLKSNEAHATNNRTATAITKL